MTAKETYILCFQIETQIKHTQKVYKVWTLVQSIELKAGSIKVSLIHPA